MNNIVINGGGYRAEINKDFGGNCVSLEFKDGVKILRAPKNIEELKATPLLYGTPLLLPPNRISGATFNYMGKKYVLPMNEPEHNNHCHGEMYHTPINVEKITENSAILSFESKEGDLYLDFPHPFKYTVTYSVDESGLTQKVSVTNDSDEIMPFAVAFHTTFNLAFEGGNPEDYSLYIPAVHEYIREMVDYIPTGEIDLDFAEKKELRLGVWKPAKHFITKFMKLDGEVCKITNDVTGKTVKYWCSAEYGFRHIFNGGSKEFICIEPQTCATDALNLTKDDSSVIGVKPKQTITLYSKISVE